MSQLRSVCIVHIGAPKTGSTAVQKYMAGNRDLLLNKGVLYFATNLRGWGHHDVAFLLGGGYPDWATPQYASLSDMIPGFASEIAAHHGSVLLSSENFYIYPNPEGLRDFLERTGIAKSRRVVILVYVRRQDDAHESWYNQTIKAQGYTHTCEECINRFHELWDYRARISPWAEEFGDDAIVVRPYESSSLVGGSVVVDVLNILGIDSSTLPRETGRVNTGINRDILEFQRILNGLKGSCEEKRQFHKALTALSMEMQGAGLFTEAPSIGVERRKNLLKEYACSNEAVARNYLGRDQLFQDNQITQRLDAEGYKGLTVKRYAAILNWLASYKA